jgi:hypothetical protein
LFCILHVWFSVFILQFFDKVFKMFF